MSDMNNRIHKPRKGTEQRRIYEKVRVRGSRLAAAAVYVMLFAALVFCAPVRWTFAAQMNGAAPAGQITERAAASAADPAQTTVIITGDEEAEGAEATEEPVPETENMIPFSQGIELQETPGAEDSAWISDEMPGQYGEGRQGASAPGQPMPDAFSDESLWGERTWRNADEADSLLEKETALGESVQEDAFPVPGEKPGRGPDEGLSGGDIFSAGGSGGVSAGGITGGDYVYGPENGFAGDRSGRMMSDGTMAMTSVTEESSESMIPADDIRLTAEYGFEGMAKGGRYLPLTVTVENDRTELLTGHLLIRTLESDGTIYQYEYNVEAEPFSDFVSSYYVPLGNSAEQLFLTLTDSEGATIINKKLSLSISRDVPDLFIGILSDEPSKLQYLDGIGISYSTLRTRCFELEPDEFPDDVTGLSLLDVLVVNNFKLRKLSEKQTAAIMDWVHNGGVLILGTGERVDDTLGRFAPVLLDDSYESEDLRHIDLSEEYSMDSPQDGMLTIPCVDIPLHGGNVLISSGGFPLFTAASKERGMIVVSAFDLGDISHFCEKYNGYVDFLFTRLLGEKRIGQLAEMVYSGNSSQYWSVQSLINTGDVDKLPNLTMYVIVVLIYLLILGPGLYLCLKDRELQMHYRKGVMICSLVFAALIYVLGSTTRFRSTFYTYATIEDVTEDYVVDTTYLNIRNPYNKPYTVSLNPEYSVLPITRYYQYRSSDDTTFNGDEQYQIAIRPGAEATTIRGQGIAAFVPRYFRLEKKADNADRIGITGDVDYFEGRITGTVTNHFPYALEKATLLLYGNMVELGRMEPGETKNLEEFELLRFPLNNSYVVANRVTGEGEFEGTNIDDKEFMLAMERSNLMIFYLDNYMSGYMADARVIAFCDDRQEGEFLTDPSAEIYGIKMLTSSVSVNASQDRTLYRSVLMKTPKIVSGGYQTETNSMNGMEPLTLEYQLGTDIAVESLTFEAVSEEFLNTDKNHYIEVFTGSIYFYNYSTGNFDTIELEGKTMNVDALGPYLSPGNTLTVRYVYEGTGSFSSIQLPMPMVAGRER